MFNFAQASTVLGDTIIAKQNASSSPEGWLWHVLLLIIAKQSWTRY